MAKIMVIDDSATVRHLIRKLLESNGHEVSCWSSTVTLPLRLQSEKPDLVLLDVSMPLLTGDRSVETMRKSGTEVTALLVLYSAKPEAELKALAKKCGADGYIQKDVGHAELIRRIAEFLERGCSDT